MATVWRTAWGVFSMVALVCVVIAAVAWVRDWRRGTTELGDERDRLRPTPAAMIAMGTLLQPAASPRSLSAQRERQSAGRDRGQATRPITTDAKPINQDRDR
jgi:hypothetical protein